LTADVAISLSTGQATNITVSAPSWLALESISAPGTNTVPGNFRVRYIPANNTGGATTGQIVLSGLGLTTTAITVNVSGGGTSGITASPSALGFTQAGGTQNITLTNTQTGILPAYILGLTYNNGSGWLSVSPTPNTGVFNSSATISVTAVPAGLAVGTYTAQLTITPSGASTAALTIPITLTVGSATGRVLSVSPSQLSLSGTTPGTVTLTATGVPAGTPIPYTVQNSRSDLVSFSGPSPNLMNGSTITITPTSVGATTPNTPVTLTIIPDGSTGFNSATVNITLNPGGSTGRVLNPSVSQVNLSSSVTQTLVTVTPSTGEPIPYTLQLSPSLLALQTNGLFQVFASTSTIPGTGAQFSFTVPNPALVPSTSGSVQIVPAAATGYATLTIPVTINGAGTGTGSVVVTPSSLAISGFIGSATAATQNLSITSSDPLASHSFFVTATSVGNWLTVSASTGITPSTLVVGANLSTITTPGSYSGQITIIPQTGLGANVPITIPVTLTVTAQFTVTLTPTSLSLTSAAGSGTPATGTVQVAASAGNPAFTPTVTTGDGGSWLSVTSSSTTLPATLTVTANPTGLAQGTYSGNIAIVSGGTTVANIPISFAVVPAANIQLSPSVLTFAHQTTTGTNPPAQTVQVTSSGATLNFSATATSSGNWLSVTPASGTTPGTLSVSVNPTGLQPGSYQGSISVSSPGALNNPQTLNVTLTVATPTLPQVSSILNGGSLAPTVAVPGLIFSIFGSDLGPATPSSATVSGGAIDTTLGGVRVLFDGIAAPLLYVSANQINGVMPFELFGRFTTRMQVEYRSQRSREIELRVSDSGPGIFTFDVRGSGQGAVLNQNGTINSSSNPEARGSVIVIYATGLGQTNPSSVTGRVATTTARPLAPVTVRIGGREAQVVYAGAAPGLIGGAAQINAVIPADAPTGPNVPVEIQAGSSSSQANVTVSVR
jgi:uncharacterized protein (TIGR03437 family)